MKKILSLLTALTLTASGASSVISCGTNQANKDQQKADAIKKKIANTAITIPSIGVKHDASKDKTIIDAALKAANKDLTKDDLKTISYTGNLTQGSATKVTATITVGTKKATKDLQVTWQTNQQEADAIKNKIQHINITIENAKLNPDTSTQNTKDTIKKALQKANTSLTADDLQKITYSKTTLVQGTQIDVTATITVGTAGKATKTLKITWVKTDEERVAVIKNKIANTSIKITGDNVKSDASQDKTIIDKALQAANNSLTDPDLTTISYSKTTLVQGTQIDVTATITVGTAKDTITLKVTWTKDQEHANEIVATLNNAKIDPIKLSINGNKQKLSDYFQSDIKAKLDAKLTDTEKTYNYSLVNDQNITNIAKDFNVKIKVGIGTSSSSFVLKVSLDYKQVTKDNGGIPNSNIIDEVIKFKTSIYVGTEKGLYVSSDGTNFTTVNNDVLKANDITAMFVVKNTIYIGVNAGSNNDLYTSTDGINFNKLALKNIPGDAQIDSISSFKDKIYVGTSKGLYVSSDGTSFTIVNNDVLKKTNILNMFVAKDNIYIGTQGSGLYISNDGTTFTQANVIPTNSLISTISQIGTTLYVGTASKGYYSSSNGTTFTQQSQFNDKGVSTITKIGLNIYICVATHNTTTGKTTGTYYISSDDGQTFNKLESQFASSPARFIKQINNNMIYIGTATGLYYNFVS